MKRILLVVLLGCSWIVPARAQSAAYAIYAEYARDANKLMHGGLNRRLFNVVEAQSGTDIQNSADGSIWLQPGTYRIAGFSLVTMQTTFHPPALPHDLNYPGYCLVYPVAAESSRDILSQAIVIGSPGTAADGAASTFDAVYTARERTAIAVGHQSGEKLNDEVYLSVYAVDGIPSKYHVFARVAINRL